MDLRTKTVLKDNKTTKSLKITIGESHYTMVVHKNRKNPIGNSNYELTYSCRRYYTNNAFMVDGWEYFHTPQIPRDLVYSMIEFLKTHDEPFSEDSLETFDSTGKYNSKLYELSAHVVRICPVSNYLYIGRGGTYSDSSFCVDLSSNVIYDYVDGTSTPSGKNVLDGTTLPYFGYDNEWLSTEESEQREVQNFNCSLLPNYEIYVELRDFIEKVKNDPAGTYEWPFKTFLPYGEIK